MRKIAALIVRLRYPLMICMLLLCIPAAACISRTVINYDLTSYLQDDTQTKRGLNLMSQEFQSPSIQRVLFTCDEAQVQALAASFSQLDGVLSASFNPEEDTRTSEDGTVYRLITLITSEEKAEDVFNETEQLLKDIPHRVGGSVKESRLLRESIQAEIPPVMLVSCLIVLVILLLMSTSFVEPLLFFAVIGVSILLNMGTNFVFSSISFITFAVAAILQLALSMDYSIILINAYDRELQGGLAPREAMIQALAASFMPVLSSSLTTVAGMVSLMFMSFTFGFDIGMVLAKGILLSMLTVFLMMPGLMILLTPLMRCTRHKPLQLSGHFLARMLQKSKGVVAILLLVLIAAGAVVQSGNVYTYTASSKEADTQLIEKLYGQSNQVVVLFPKGSTDADYARQEETIRALSAITVDGKPVVTSAYAMVTTGEAAIKSYTSAEAARLLGMDEAWLVHIASTAGVSFPVRGDVMVQKVWSAIWEKQYTAADAADLLGQSEAIIAAYASAFDITLPARGDQVLQAMYQATMVQTRSAGEMAGMLGISPTAMNLYATMAGIRFPATVYEIAQRAQSASGPLSLFISTESLDQLMTILRLIEVMPQAMEALNQAKALMDTAKSTFDGRLWSRALLTMDISYQNPGAEDVVNQMFAALQNIWGENWAVTGMLIAIRDIAVTFSHDIQRVSLITVIALLLIIAFSFRSIKIPIILVCVIQGAVFINMAFSGMVDGSIFFMCYLICLALQMGATIDYGILLTSHYQSARSAGMPPWSAVSTALSKSMQTIATSGLALITAGFTVGKLSSVFYISSIGTMLGRGAVVSVLLILLLLPQLLVWLIK